MSFRRLLSFLAGVFLSAASVHAQGVITTVAGATWTFPAGVTAANVPLGQIEGMASDSSGNIYAVDTPGAVVVKISPAGTVTLIAGTGSQGFSGDGGPATSATFNAPQGIALDGAGNVYVADTGNRRVRKIDTTGKITTIAGGGGGFSGDGGPAVGAGFSNPSGIAVDSAGNVYISDSGNSRIRKVDTSGIVTTFAGNGTAGFSGDGGAPTSASLNNPQGLALDAQGALYIADWLNNRIRKIPHGGAISTVAGNGNGGFSGDGGPAVSAQLSSPQAIALDAQGNLYIADNNNRIRKVGVSGLINTVAGQGTMGVSGDGGSALSARLAGPLGVAVDPSGNIYIGDSYSHKIRVVNASGTINTFAGSGQFKYSPDGGLATSSFFSFPQWSGGVAVDANGNIFVADTGNQRVRKISPTGVVTTVAGNGTFGYSGDGGPATQASLALDSNSSQQSLAVDRAGNLYIADTDNSRVRKVDATGTITTFAGGGNGAVGDGGPAASATVRPFGITFDAGNNLYIVDGQNRVRKVTNGTISTVAGTGQSGFSGDGGLATAAQLSGATSVAVDAAGNIYIADSFNFRIRQVNPAGVISTFAGTGQTGCTPSGTPASQTSFGIEYHAGLAVDTAGSVYLADTFCSTIQKISGGTVNIVVGTGAQDFSGDGGFSTSAGLRFPTAITFDSSGNLYFVDSQNDRVRKVFVNGPAFSVSPSSLSFTAPATTATPASAQLSTASTVNGLIYSVQSSTTDGNPWLTFSPPTAYAPGGVTVSASAASLQPGTYQGTITIQSPLASTPNQNVAVQFVVTKPVPPSLALSASSMTFDYLVGGASPGSHALTISNSGGGSLSWTAALVTEAGGNWLSISSTSGTSTASAPGVSRVSVNPAGLTEGSYTGIITVQSATTGQSLSVTVALVVTQPKPTLLVSQTGLLFTTVAGGGGVPPQTVGVLNTGQTTMNWTAAASTVSGGSWLGVTPESGTSQPNSLQVPLATVSVNAASLSAGTYYGIVTIAAPGARNAPQAVTVVLNVLPAGSNPGVLVRPTGLIFTTTVGTNPSAQSVTLNTPVPGSLGFAEGLLTFDGGTWLTSGTQNSVLQSGVPLTVNVQPSASGLSPGVRRGTLTLLFADGISQTVNVLFLVVNGGGVANGGGSSPDDRRSPAAAACNPTQLLGVTRSLQNGGSYSTSVGYPVSLEVQLTDDCANVVTNATVTATFSNGDPPVPLVSLGTGIYTGTWQPQSSGAFTIIQISAQAPSLPTLNLTPVAYGVNANASAPVVGQGGIVNGASFAAGAPVAPGSIVSVFGQQLGSTPLSATKTPLPTTLGGVSVNVGGINAPLFYGSSGQINAQVPFETPPSSQQQVVVLTPQAAAVPQAITVVPARPGMFLAPSTAAPNQGAIVTPAGALVNASAPAVAGDVVLIYATGLGAVDQPVTTGAPPPTNPVPNALSVPKVAIGGQSAAVQFAGLAPGFVGLYQINVQIPAGIKAGNTVPLVLTQNGVAANTVTLAIK